MLLGQGEAIGSASGDCGSFGALASGGASEGTFGLVFRVICRVDLRSTRRARPVTGHIF